MTRVSTPAATSTPYALLTAAETPREASKRDLVRLSRELERVALATPPVGTGVAAALQDVRYLTDRTRAVYAQLAEAGVPVRMFARGLQGWLAPGVAGVALDDDDPLVDEWVVVLPGSDPVAFAATDLHSGDCAEDDRSFNYVVSRDPHLVASVARLLGL